MFALPRFYPIADAGACEARGLDVADVAQALLDGGARILQFRFKDALTVHRLEQAQRIAEACHRAGVPFAANDRADLALLTGAAVLHLGQDDLPPAAARQLLPQGIIGFSTHNAAQMRAAAGEPINYAAFGPIFATQSKQRPDPTTGLDLLREIRTLTTRPLTAIGGITLETAPSVFAAGADSIAVIGDLLPPECTLDKVRRRVARWIESTC
jgi:thiamine-phosphate pyrophosphorylase